MACLQGVEAAILYALRACWRVVEFTYKSLGKTAQRVEQDNNILRSITEEQQRSNLGGSAATSNVLWRKMNQVFNVLAC